MNEDTVLSEKEKKSRSISTRQNYDDVVSSGVIQRYRWMDMARCKGETDKMFPKGHKDISYIKDAREMCANCTVRPHCLEYAIQFPPADMHGVWAGLTSRQLAAEQRRRGTGPTRPTLSQMWGD